MVTDHRLAAQKYHIKTERTRFKLEPIWWSLTWAKKATWMDIKWFHDLSFMFFWRGVKQNVFMIIIHLKNNLSNFWSTSFFSTILAFLEPLEIALTWFLHHPSPTTPRKNHPKSVTEIHPGHSEEPEEYVEEHRRYTQGSPSRPTNPWTAQEPGFCGLFPPSTQCCATRGWCAGLHTWQEDEWR